MTSDADPKEFQRQLLAAGERYATLLEHIKPTDMTRSWRDAIDAINKRINAACDNVFGFETTQ